MMQETRTQIPGLLEHIAAACAFVGKAAQDAGLDERTAYHCQLAVDEACTNIIEHGYQLKGADKIIDIICRYDFRAFAIILIDDGPPFNPLQRESPNPKAALHERTTSGGWGIHFIRQMMDDVHYEWRGRNYFSMVKRRIG
ncbi:MAG: ATP-binding protein [Anaerolineaceae bacterium]|nr:ATP-binding protein [Anaerolineaceae bacterium]